MSEELAALDREWHRVAGLNGVVAPVSSHALACFAPKGPWEWLKNELAVAYFVVLEQENIDSASCFVTNYQMDNPVFRGEGRTIFEAITRCAIEAHKKLEAKDE